MRQDRFKAKVDEWKSIIEGVESAGLRYIIGTIAIVEKQQNDGHDGVTTMLVFAVCVEMMEPAEAVRP